MSSATLHIFFLWLSIVLNMLKVVILCALVETFVVRDIIMKQMYLFVLTLIDSPGE